MIYVILTVGLILRLVYFNQSLWLDEAIQGLAFRGHYGPILDYALADFQPPLYHLLGIIWTSIAGTSEIALRTPSLIAGLFTVFFSYRLGTLLQDKMTGLIASLLVATNPLLIYYSQEGRTYMLTAFAVTASFYYLLSILKKANNSRLFTIYFILFTITYLWTSYLSWFVLIAQGYLIFRAKRWDVLKLLFLAASTWILWLPSFFRSLAIGMGDASASPEWGRVVGGTSLKALALTWIKFNLGRISFTDRYVYAGIIAIQFLWHSYIFAKLRQFAQLLPLIVWLVIPLVLSAAISLYVPAYSYTRVLFLLPAYLLLMAIALRNMKPFYLGGVVISQLLCLGLYWATPRFHHEDWRTLANDLVKDKTATIAIPNREQDPGLIYYGIPESRILEPSHESLSGDPIYYVRYAEEIFDVHGLGKTKLIESGYTLSSQQVYNGIALDIYSR